MIIMLGTNDASVDKQTSSLTSACGRPDPLQESGPEPPLRRARELRRCSFVTDYLALIKQVCA